MDKEKNVEAYNKLLNAVLDFLQENKVIDYKDSNLIMQYVMQNDKSKKLVKRKKIDKILNKKYHVSIPLYSELKQRKENRLSFSGDYSEQKAIHDLLEERVNSGRSGATNNIYYFLKDLISEVKLLNQSKTIDEQSASEFTFNEDFLNSSESAKHIETKKHIEEKNVSDLNTVKDIMMKEEMAFDKALDKGDMSSFDLGESYTLKEKKRKEYLTEILSVTISQKQLEKNYKKLDNNVASSMIRNAEEIENLIVQNLLEVNFNMSAHSELYEQTLLKSKYNPHKLLEQYKKLYEEYKKQFDKLSGEEKRRINAVCESNGINFITSPEEIITKINTRLQEKMVEYEVGTSSEDRGKLCGSYALTTYMKLEQIARTEYLIKEKQEKKFKTRSVTEYDIEEEWKRAWKLNISGVSKKTIRKGLEEKYRKENETILDMKKEKQKNLQYNYSSAIYVKDDANRSLTEICRDVLHEEPMFEESEKEKKSRSLIEPKGFSFRSIKAAIRRALDDKER